jgi:hypothetical protein
MKNAQMHLPLVTNWIRMAHLPFGKWILVAVEAAVVTTFSTLLWVVDRPGVFAVDSMLQWYEGYVGRFASNHPPALGFLWNQLAAVGEPASLLVGLSCLSFCAGAYLIARFHSGPKASMAILTTVALFPPVFAQGATINKETISCHLLVLGFGLALHARRRGTSWWPSMFAAATAAVAVMIRYQYVVAAAALYVACLLPRPDTGRWGLLRALVRPVVVWTGIFASFVAALAIWIEVSATVDWQAPFTINLRQQREYELSALVARAKTPPELSELAAAGVDVSQVIAAMRRDYTPLSNVPALKEIVPLLASVPTEVIAQQVVTLSHEQPNVLLAHRIATFSRLLGLYDVCWPVQKQIIRPPLGTPERLWADTVGASNLPDSIASRIFNSRWFPVNNLFFRPILYLVISSGLLLWFASTTSRRITWGLLAGLPFSGLVYAATFAMITPSCDFRYLYWTVLSATLAVAIVFSGVLFGSARRQTKVSNDKVL